MSCGSLLAFGSDDTIVPVKTVRDVATDVQKHATVAVQTGDRVDIACGNDDVVDEVTGEMLSAFQGRAPQWNKDDDEWYDPEVELIPSQHKPVDMGTGTLFQVTPTEFVVFQPLVDELKTRFALTTRDAGALGYMTEYANRWLIDHYPTRDAGWRKAILTPSLLKAATPDDHEKRVLKAFNNPRVVRRLNMVHDFTRGVLPRRKVFGIPIPFTKRALPGATGTGAKKTK